LNPDLVKLHIVLTLWCWPQCELTKRVIVI